MKTRLGTNPSEWQNVLPSENNDIVCLPLPLPYDPKKPPQREEKTNYTKLGFSIDSTLSNYCTYKEHLEEVRKHNISVSNNRKANEASLEENPTPQKRSRPNPPEKRKVVGAYTRSLAAALNVQSDVPDVPSVPSVRTKRGPGRPRKQPSSPAL